MNDDKKTYTLEINSQTLWKILAIGFGVLFLILLVSRYKQNDSSPELAKTEQNPNAITEAASAQTVPENSKDFSAQVLPAQGIVLPVKWGDLGKRLVEAGVIDRAQFDLLYSRRGGMSPEEEAWLSGTDNGNLKITAANSSFLLNLLWALGLGNKNSILDNGPMQDQRYGGAGGFASTGGWTLAKGDAMNHYSKYEFVKLTAKQQELVERVSQGVFRPCCGNSTYFPDCNHGMAMLGLLELGAAQGMSEEELFRMAFQVNSFWFPDTYLTLANYFDGQGVAWDAVDPKIALSADYSSAQGFKSVRSKVQPVQSNGGGGCGV